MSVRKEGHAELPMTLAEAYGEARKGILVIGASIRNEDRAGGRIEAKIGLSWRSWGENLLVNITGADDDARVSITSSSALRTTLFDFGKNQNNVDRFLDWLR